MTVTNATAILQKQFPTFNISEYTPIHPPGGAGIEIKTPAKWLELWIEPSLISLMEMLDEDENPTTEKDSIEIAQPRFTCNGELSAEVVEQVIKSIVTLTN
jgi:hypothetical protein